MPRTARAAQGGYCYHVINRGNELERLRRSVRRGCPYGAEAWVHEAAARLGLESTLRSPGHQRRSLEVDSEGDSLPLFREV